jgi:replicative DNA helicase
VRDASAHESVSPLLPILIEEFDILEARGENRGAITGVETGYKKLDAILKGLQPTSLTIVGARPSVGKTAFSLGILLHVGAVIRRPALYFSLEMSRNELAERILATSALIDSSRLKTGDLTNAELVPGPRGDEPSARCTNLRRRQSQPHRDGRARSRSAHQAAKR